MQNIKTDRRYYELQRAEIARLIVGSPKNILEIGCASGFFKRNIKWECDYHGVEPMHEAANCARESGIIVYEGTYQDVEEAIPDKHFDLIVCNDVIEHMADPWGFLRSIKKKLVPNGYVMGSLPNVRYLLNLKDLLFRRDWHYVSGGVLDYTHLRFFTLKSARRLFGECGYVVEELKPSGPDRFRLLKKVLTPFFWPLGVDTLYMQMAFRMRVSE